MRFARWLVLALLLAGSAAAEVPAAPVKVEGVRLGPGDITVLGLDCAYTVLTRQKLAALPRVKASLKYSDKGSVYEGVSLSAVLGAVGVPTGPALRGKAVSALVWITGADGYQAVIALADTDASFRDGAIILADRRTAGPLSDEEGPWRLVIENDKRAERSVRDVRRIEVRGAAACVSVMPDT